MKTKRILILLALFTGGLFANGLQAQSIAGKVCDFFFNRYNSAKTGEKVTVYEGEFLGTIHYRGWTPGEEYQTGAAIRSVVTATPAVGFLPANLIFYTGGAELQSRMTITEEGNVGIGTETPFSKLHVDGNTIISKDLMVDQNIFAMDRMSVGTQLSPLGNTRLLVDGGILAGEIEVIDMDNWPDYVFLPDYEAPTAAELETFIQQHGHLPGVPSAAEVKENGLNLGEMQARLLEKIEELTLIVIEQQKQIDSLKEQLNPTH